MSTESEGNLLDKLFTAPSFVDLITDVPWAIDLVSAKSAGKFFSNRQWLANKSLARKVLVL